MSTSRSRIIKFLATAALTVAFGAAVPLARAELFVVDSGDNAVRMYDQTTGEFLGNFADNTGIDAPRQLRFPFGAAFGPDGSLFVAGFDNSALLRFSAIGGNRGKFASANTSPSFGQPGGVILHGGLLYVADAQLNNVKRFDPTKAPADAFVDVFANTGLSQPEGMAFGPDGNLYVCSRNNQSIVRFNGSSGALIGTLNNLGSGLSMPEDLAFDAQGRLYVADSSLTLSGKIVRFNVSTGQFTDYFVNNDPNLSNARSLAFGPGGKLFVGDSGNATVRRYSTAGASEGVFITANSGGLSAPFDLIFAAPGGGAKLILSFHWWGILALTCLVGALHLRHRRSLARAQAL